MPQPLNEYEIRLMELAKQSLDAYAHVVQVSLGDAMRGSSLSSDLVEMQRTWADGQRHLGMGMEMARQMMVLSGNGFPAWWGALDLPHTKNQDQVVPATSTPTDISFGSPQVHSSVSRDSGPQASLYQHISQLLDQFSPESARTPNHLFSSSDDSHGGSISNRVSGDRSSGGEMGNVGADMKGRSNEGSESNMAEEKRAERREKSASHSQKPRKISFKGLNDLVGNVDSTSFLNESSGSPISQGPSRLTTERQELPLLAGDSDQVAEDRNRPILWDRAGSFPNQMASVLEGAAQTATAKGEMEFTQSEGNLPVERTSRSAISETHQQLVQQVRALTGPPSALEPLRETPEQKENANTGQGNAEMYLKETGSQSGMVAKSNGVVHTPMRESSSLPAQVSQAVPFEGTEFRFLHEDSLRGSSALPNNPPPTPYHQAQDIEDVIEELTKNLNREYKRYYGL